jgi:hypothetical protein
MLVDPWLWIASLTFILSVHFAFYLCLAAFALQSERKLLNTIILSSLAPSIEFILGTPYTFSALFLVATYLTTRNRKFPHITILAIISAFSFYFKAEIGLLSFGIVLVATAWAYFKERCLKSLVPLIAYVISLVGIGLVVTGSLQILDSFLFGYMQIGAGYQSAMSIEVGIRHGMPQWFILFPLLTGIAILILVVKDNLRIPDTRLFFTLSFPFLFITYKEGFVRADLHVLVFFSCWALFCLLLQSTFAKSGRRASLVAIFLALILLGTAIQVMGMVYVSNGEPINGATLLKNTSVFVQNVYGFPRFQATFRNFEYVTQPTLSQATFDDTILATRSTYPLSENTVTMLRGHTVDILPWDDSLAYVYGLQWNPAPMFQTITAYTPYLDGVNARHYSSGNTPDFVLYRPEAKDGRYPFFDEPLALMALACNYVHVGNDASFFILQRRSSDVCDHMDLLAIDEIKFGQPIQVPTIAQTPVIACVYLENSWLGMISTFLYQVPKVMINLEFNNGLSQNYTLVVATASDGLLLRPGFLSTSLPLPAVNQFTLFTRGPEYYKPAIMIKIYGIRGVNSTSNGEEDPPSKSNYSNFASFSPSHSTQPLRDQLGYRKPYEEISARLAEYNICVTAETI